MKNTNMTYLLHNNYRVQQRIEKLTSEKNMKNWQKARNFVISYGVLRSPPPPPPNFTKSVSFKEGIMINPLDPTDFTFDMRYFPRLSPNFLKIPLNFEQVYLKSKFYQGLPIYQNGIISFAFGKVFWGL